MKQPLKAVDALLQAVEKQFGKGAMMRLGDRQAARVPCISTGWSNQHTSCCVERIVLFSMVSTLRISTALLVSLHASSLPDRLILLYHIVSVSSPGL